MSDDVVRWVATLSDGSTAVEHAGDFQILPGERKPWVRLCEFTADNGLHLTSLRLNFKGRTIHMPRSRFDRFDMNVASRAPLFYSLQYHMEAEMSSAGFLESQTLFVDLAAHFEFNGSKISVHYIQDVTEGNNSWIIVNEDWSPLAATPREN